MNELLTEQPNPHTSNIDRLSTLAMLEVINREDMTVARVVHDALPSIAEAVEAIATAIRRGGRLIYVGAGTSGRLAMLDAVECVPTFGADPDLVQAVLAGGDTALTRAVEGVEDQALAGRQDLMALNLSMNDAVVGIAASGRTPYVLGAIQAANEVGALTIGVACNVPSKLLDLARIRIAAPVGPEVIAGSTRLKAGTAQKMILNMLSTGSMIKLGKVYGNLMVDVKVTNEKLAQRARWIVSEVADIDVGEATKLLELTNYEVKTAIIVGKLNIPLEDARALLQRVNGDLRNVFEG
jgi:N-acetylmuramic acid 6-phosphate etherase